MLDLEKVEYAEFELSTRCNARCPLCYRNYKAFDKHYPENIERDVDSIFTQIKTMPNLKWIYLVGSISEPTLHSRFLDIVRFIKSRGILVELCTNGSTRNDIFWRSLGMLLTEEDKVYFTICGSTQEIHEQYRRGTNLAKIMRSAAALRSVRTCDYAQCIRFSYNNDDFNSEEFQKIVEQFSHVYMTETFIQQPLSAYREKFDQELFRPWHHRFDFLQNIVEKNCYKPHKCDCESLEFKKIQVDVYGNIYPCYLFLEASDGKKWDMNYGSILAGKYDCCRFCERSVKRYLIKHGLECIV